MRKIRNRKNRDAPTPSRVTDTSNDLSGRVIANYGATLAFEDEQGGIHRAVARKRIGLPVCGDRVSWQPQTRGDSVITGIEARQSVLERPDHRGHPKALAANFSRLIVVNAPSPGISPEMIDCFLAAAESMGVTPLLVINKSDLLSTQEREKVGQLLKRYRELGYESLLVNTLDGDGLDPLRQALHQQTAIFVGQSGVGKSSIIQHLLPNREIRVGALSQATGLGKHTTTTTILYPLPDGGELIDSPGVREYSLENFSQPQIARGFREFDELAPYCKFNNCTHLVEPNCAVQAAVTQGKIDSQRMFNYQKICASLKNSPH
ncbi:MAG: ribosome small subunit-dependent GTPase A [Gammaproteobacteria bacterium]|nr:ribosome small subunit-dependent GTPase A [Gammaproteobacteria bacterium]